MGRPEAYVEHYLVHECQKHNILCYKFMSGIDGVPDRILIGYGKTWFVETKKPGGKPRELQTVVFDNMRDHGAKVFVASSRDEVDDVIKEMIG